MSAGGISVVGTGPVAHAIALAQVRGGGTVRSVLSRSRERAESLASACGAAGADEFSPQMLAEVVIVAVADRAVAEVGARLARSLAGRKCLVLHTSGALPGTTLLAQMDGAQTEAPPAMEVGSLHPLQALPRTVHPLNATALDATALDAAALADSLRGAHWFHEGAGPEVGRRLVAAWEGHFHPLAPGTKTLYHAGAAILSNHTVALFHAALRLFEDAGVPREAAWGPLSTLLSGTAANVARLGVPGALTGPVARGDVETVREHLRALRASAPDLLPSYRELARIAVAVARAQGAARGEDLRAIEELLSE